MIKQDGEPFIDIRMPGIGGLNNFDDASVIGDLELADATNVIYDGFLQPRTGSTLSLRKPTVEAGDPLQLITAKTSDGIEYRLAIYDNHIYLWHDENEEWIRINQTYVPDETTIRYGWTPWNNGRGDDRVYACNGVDNFWRWDMAVSTVNGAHLSAATSLALTDSTRFPATGTLVIKGSSGEFTKAYTANSANSLTLDGALGQDVADGASITLDVTEKSGMELGKIVTKWASRLMVMNYYGGETVLWYSKLSDPETFTPGANVEDAGTQGFSDGNGQITGGHDFGQFFVVEKEDSLHTFSFEVADDLGSKLAKVEPILSGQSLGPLSQQSTVKVLNKLYYPTRSEGFIALSPTTSGGQASIGTETISSKIHSYATDKIEKINCVGKANDQKIFWAVALSGGTQNIQVLMYDLLKNAWSIIKGWAVQDFTTYADELYYLDNSTGDIYKVLDGSYNDNDNPYEVSAYTKRYDFGHLAMPKLIDKVYVQGFLTSVSDLFIDVLYNEGGKLHTDTFRLNKDTPRIFISQPLTNAQGQFILGNPMMGGVILSEIGDVSFFRCYLGVSSQSAMFNLQIKIYSNKQAFWGITGLSINPEVAKVAPANMVIDTTQAELITPSGIGTMIIGDSFIVK